MRFRKLAGLLAGTLVAGSAAALSLTAPAQAADGTTTGYMSVGCTSGSNVMNVYGNYDVTVTGLNVTMTLANPVNPGAPTLNLSELGGTAQLSIGDQDVTVTGLSTFNPTRAGNTDIEMPVLTGTLAAAPTGSAVDMDAFSLKLKMQYTPVTQTVACVKDTVVSKDFTCTYQSFKMFYRAELHTRAKGTAVQANFSNTFSAGMPAFLNITDATPTVGVTVDSETVSLSGTTTFATAIPGNQSLPLPKVTGARTGTSAAPTFAVDSFGVTLKINGADYVIPCAPYVPTVTTTAIDFTCAYSSYAMPVTGTLTTTYNGTSITGDLTDITLSAMPPTFTVNSAKAAITAKAGNVDVALASPVQTYPNPLPANSALPMPDATGTSTSVLYPAATTVSKIVLTLNVSTPYGTANADVNCATPVDTTTSLVASSPSANTVDLAATVTANVPGKVQFKDGTGANLGTAVTVASGAAAKTLTGVTAGTASYTAVFTPTDLSAHKASTSAAASVTVNDPSVATTTALTATSANPGAVTLAATVTPATASGSVAFYEAGTKVGEAPLVNGNATKVLTGVSGGTHSYIAIFTSANQAQWTNSETSSVSVTVTAAPVAVTTSTKLTVTTGTAKATLKAVVTPASAGSVAFFDGTKKVGTKTVANGSATLTLTGVASGKHAYKAVFTPANASAAKASTSTVVAVTIKAATTTKLTLTGAKKKATIAVTVSGGTAKATGKVTVVLTKGKVTKKKTITLAKGAGKITVTGLAKGTWTVAATYAGDSTHVTSKKSGTVSVK